MIEVVHGAVSDLVLGSVGVSLQCPCVHGVGRVGRVGQCRVSECRNVEQCRACRACRVSGCRAACGSVG